MSKIIWALVAVIIIGAGAWWYVGSGVGPAAPQTTALQNETLNQVQASSSPAAEAAQTPSSGASTGSVSASASADVSASSSDDSDAAMSQDAANIDSQMSGLDSDNAATDQGMNSQ